MDFRIKCPCGNRLMVNSSHIGRQVECPVCHRELVVPDPSAVKQSSPRPHAEQVLQSLEPSDSGEAQGDDVGAVGSRQIPSAGSSIRTRPATVKGWRGLVRSKPLAIAVGLLIIGGVAASTVYETVRKKPPAPRSTPALPTPRAQGPAPLPLGAVKQLSTERPSQFAQCEAVVFDGAAVLSASTDGSVYRWEPDAKKPTLLQQPKLGVLHHSEMAIAPGGRFLASVALKGDTTPSPQAGGGPGGEGKKPQPAVPYGPMQLKNPRYVLSLTPLSPPSQGGDRGGVGPGNDARELCSDKAWIRRLAFSPDGKMLASGHVPDLQIVTSGNTTQTRPVVDVRNLRCLIRLWDVATGKEIKTFTVPSYYPDVIAFSGDSKTVSIASLPHGIYRADIESGKVQHVTRPPQEFAYRSCFSADGLMVACQRMDGQVVLRDVLTGRVLQSFHTGGQLVSHMTLSPDGRFLAGSCERILQNRVSEAAIRLWEVASGQEIHLFGTTTVQPHTYAMNAIPQAYALCLAFAPDGQTLATGTMNGGVMMWNLVPPLRPEFTSGQMQYMGQVPGKPHDPLEYCWIMLSNNDISNSAYHASWALIKAKEKAVSLLKNKLKPAKKVTADIAGLARNLDNEIVEVREAAFVQVQALGPEHEPALTQALPTIRSSESRRWLAGVLANPERVRSPELLRGLRASHVLEQIGTPEAQEILRELAKGEPDACLTLDAQASLGRLGKRRLQASSVPNRDSPKAE